MKNRRHATKASPRPNAQNWRLFVNFLVAPSVGQGIPVQSGWGPRQKHANSAEHVSKVSKAYVPVAFRVETLMSRRLQCLQVANHCKCQSGYEVLLHQFVPNNYPCRVVP